VLPLQLRALAGQWQHAERELASDPAVVVAGERQWVDDLGRRGRAEPDNVAQARDLVGVRPIDRGEHAAQRIEVAVEVGNHSQAHRCLNPRAEEWTRRKHRGSSSPGEITSDTSMSGSRSTRVPLRAFGSAPLATDRVELTVGELNRLLGIEGLAGLASLLAVTPATLDKWVASGLVPTVTVPDYKRQRIPARALVDLATEVTELRRLGRKRGLLAEALSRLEQEDPEWRRQFDRLYGPGLGATAADDDPVSAAPGADWDPGD
jgi:hypothetical protein